MSIKARKEAQETRILEKFGELERSGVLNGEILSPVRKRAMDKFQSLGFPGTRDEEYKYLSFNAILNQDFNLDPSGQATQRDYSIGTYSIPSLEANTIVLVNGKYEPELSDIKNFHGTIEGLDEAIKSNPEELKSLVENGMDEANQMTSLNTAYLKNGIFIKASDTYGTDIPIHIINMYDSTDGSILSQPRKIISVDQNASLKLYETNIFKGENHTFANCVTQIKLESNAQMRHVLVQDNSEKAFAHNQLEVSQYRDSHYWNGTYSLQGAFIRNNTNVKVEGENAETHLFGLYLPMGKSQIDNHTSIDHKVPNCFSNELYKGVVGDSATGVFNGKVFVRQDAQKVNAFQSNRNILLSDTATLNTKPQLEIWADDVKCSHGATSGQLSEEELFYLQSRGISKEKARSILVYAFAAETIEAVHDDSLKECLLTKLQRQLNFEV